MKLLRLIFLFPLGLLYGLILQTRNLFFKWGIYKQIKTSFPSISVGNLAMGGTGKTPTIKFLLEQHKEEHTTVISRGYGRESSGFMEVTLDSKAIKTGDEPLEIKNAYPETQVFVCEKRKDALKKITQTDLILFDDLYQHQWVKPNCNILLTTYENPFYKDFVLPAGNLREFGFNKNRADLLVVTKCPLNLSLEKAKIIKKKCGVSYPVFFSGLEYGNTIWKKEVESAQDVLLLSSIAHATAFKKEAMSRYNIVDEIKLKDHFTYTEKKVKEIIAVANKNRARIVTTAKDMAKLNTFETLLKDTHLGYFDVRMSILFNEKEAFLKQIKNKI